MAIINISLPDELKSFVDTQVATHGFSSADEYLCDLVRKQRDLERLRQLLLDGANSGVGGVMDDAYFAELRARARQRTTR